MRSVDTDTDTEIATRHTTRAREARLRLLRMHYDAGVGHIGGNLSALDALLVLHHEVLQEDDTFVLSKGHAAGALYVTLWSTGELDDALLGEFHGDGTHLSGHPSPGWTPGIPFATGSLGHGLPVSAGIALARRLQGHPGRVFVMTSDGEWQEGSNWEALIFAHHQRLERLVILVDANGLQGFGRTDEVASVDNLRERFEAFGIATREIDGHDAAALCAALRDPELGPRAIVLRTVKGKGVSFMEDRMEWHYLPLDAELYAQAVAETEARS
jgi:transketolase